MPSPAVGSPILSFCIPVTPARIAAQVERELNPAAVTIPLALMANGITLFRATGPFSLNHFFQIGVMGLGGSDRLAPMLAGCLADDDLANLETTLFQGQRGAPGEHETVFGRLDQHSVNDGVPLLDLAAMRDEQDRHGHCGKPKAPQAIGCQILQPDLLAALWVWHLLIRRSALEIAIVKIIWEIGDPFLKPFLVVRAYKRKSRLEVAAGRAK